MSNVIDKNFFIADQKPSKVEHLYLIVLSGHSLSKWSTHLLGRFLSLPANIRLIWKGVRGTNVPTYFAPPSATKKKSFITWTPGHHPPELRAERRPRPFRRHRRRNWLLRWQLVTSFQNPSFFVVTDGCVRITWIEYLYLVMIIQHGQPNEPTLMLLVSTRAPPLLLANIRLGWKGLLRAIKLIWPYHEEAK